MSDSNTIRIGAIVRLILLAAVVVGISLFTIANRHRVFVSGWPFDFEISAPMAMVVLLSLLLGITLGSLMMAEPMISYRLRAKRSERRATVLEQQIAQLSPPPMPINSAPRHDLEHF